MQQPDVCIAGAGIIGLFLALELHHRGARVIVLDRSTPLAEASTAAAGMLAAADPHNPSPLRPLSNLSLALYPTCLDRIHSLSGIRVPFQTHKTLQSQHPAESTPRTELTAEALAHLLPTLTPHSHRFTLLDEHSLDPRQLATALLAAIPNTTIDLRPNTPVLSTRSINNSIEIQTPTSSFVAPHFVDCTGAWASATSTLPNIQVTPRKGQMLSVALPSTLPLNLVVRTPDVYIVPRTTGPNVGHAIIGATIEDAGFDKTVHPSDIARLRAAAAELLPPLATAPQLEAWAGLRPATPDGLPLLGQLPNQPRHLLATGHFRDGILLAPATAHLIAQLLTNQSPAIDLAPFSPARQNRLNL
jgi:glycine oxidase